MLSIRFIGNCRIIIFFCDYNCATMSHGALTLIKQLNPLKKKPDNQSSYNANNALKRPIHKRTPDTYYAHILCHT